MSFMECYPNVTTVTYKRLKVSQAMKYFWSPSKLENSMVDFAQKSYIARDTPPVEQPICAQIR